MTTALTFNGITLSPGPASAGRFHVHLPRVFLSIVPSHSAW